MCGPSVRPLSAAPQCGPAVWPREAGEADGVTVVCDLARASGTVPGNRMDTAELLRKHNPVLVLFPQQHDRRTRPGSRRPGRGGWGDYHPCSAEFFLHRVEQRNHPRPWSLGPRSLFGGLAPWLWRAAPRTGLEAIRERAAGVSPEDTESWELDIADLPSQDATRAWRRYRALLIEREHPYEPVVYGRHVAGRSGPALQYWYLYLYNDFSNNHEGDWEMVTIELSADGSPLRVAYSAHHAGFVRAWHDVPKHEPDGHRPLLYVARGSHAGYFTYSERGHPVIGLSSDANPPPGLRRLVAMLQKLPGLRRWRDFPPADPEGDSPENARHYGLRLEPALRAMPGTGAEPAPDSQWWWMRLRCRWGSTHTRVTGTIGIVGPWAAPAEDLRWRDPVGWLRRCRVAGD